MSDYRYFPFDRFYPNSLKNWFNFIYRKKKFNKSYYKKPIDTTFRGTVNKTNEVYSYQRNKVISFLNSSSNKNFLTGDPISKKEYINELKLSKTCISPFGWGEVCYRDFEAIIAGCILIKPDMGHLETYPDIYKKHVTYVPVEISMSDLEIRLQEVLENYNAHIPIIKKSQKEYLQVINDADGFIEHFKNIIELE